MRWHGPKFRSADWLQAFNPSTQIVDSCILCYKKAHLLAIVVMSDSTAEFEFLTPDWPAPARVKALATTRSGGVSAGAFAGLNVGAHVGDDPAAVSANRQLLSEYAGLPAEPLWLNQVHGKTVVDLASAAGMPDADAALAAEPGLVCAVMTADCLPLLLCNVAGSKVAAVHAGWRGLEAGIVQEILHRFEGDEVLAWLGPAIGPLSYEIDDKIRDHFLRLNTPLIDFDEAFEFSRPGHWFFNLYRTAKLILASAGVAEIYGGDLCTLADERFYSYRRDGVTGRQATLIWLDDNPK
jgi:polyphenol oxidase